MPGAQWFLRSIGSIRNPIGNGSKTTRMLTAKVTVQPTLTQPKNNPVWDYLYAGHTGSTCDQTLNNNISGSSRMYVAGNLCLSPNVNLAQSMVIVRGNLDLSNNASVGANTSMNTRVDQHLECTTLQRLQHFSHWGWSPQTRRSERHCVICSFDWKNGLGGSSRIFGGKLPLA